MSPSVKTDLNECLCALVDWAVRKVRRAIMRQFALFVAMRRGDTHNADCQAIGHVMVSVPTHARRHNTACADAFALIGMAVALRCRHSMPLHVAMVGVAYIATMVVKKRLASS